MADPRVVKFYFSNAPEAVEPLELVRISGMRWPVELTFAESKEELGMDQYETRSWLGWRHHMVLVMLAHHFLVWVRGTLDRSRTGADAGPGAVVAGERDPHAASDCRTGAAAGAVVSTSEPCRLPFTPQTEACPVSRFRPCVVILITY